MSRYILLFFFLITSLVRGEEKLHILYKAVAKKHEVLPTVVYPPSGGDQMPKKSLLGTFLLGKKLHNYELEKDFLKDLYDRLQNKPFSDEPFFSRGVNYILKTPSDEFYLIFYENDHRLKKEMVGKRFRINLLIKIAETPVFVRSAKVGGVSRDESVLRLLRGVSEKERGHPERAERGQRGVSPWIVDLNDC